MDQDPEVETGECVQTAIWDMFTRSSNWKSFALHSLHVTGTTLKTNIDNQ